MWLFLLIQILLAKKLKIAKYQDLYNELQRIWNLKNVRVIPIVIGCLGSYMPNY